MDLESGVMSKVYIIPHSKIDIYKHFNKAATHVGVPPQMLENIKPKLSGLNQNRKTLVK